jgi:hypothetical protein
MVSGPENSFKEKACQADLIVEAEPVIVEKVIQLDHVTEQTNQEEAPQVQVIDPRIGDNQQKLESLRKRMAEPDDRQIKYLARELKKVNETNDKGSITICNLP